MTDLAVVDVPVAEIHANRWNPNRQTEREREAERESIEAFGFIDPILLRRDDAGGFEVIDGEHRWRTVLELKAAGRWDGESIPAIIVDVDDTAAMKLTVVMNETRGHADPGQLARLLADLEAGGMTRDELRVALPYTSDQLAGYLTLGSFDWESLPMTSSEPDLTVRRIVLEVPVAVADRWDATVRLYEDPKACFIALLTKAREVTA